MRDDPHRYRVHPPAPGETGPAIGSLLDAGAGGRNRAALRSPRRRASTRCSRRAGPGARRSGLGRGRHLLRARAATGRSSPRCVPTRARACRCSRSTSARSAFWPRSIARARRPASGRPSTATSRCSRCRGSRSRGERGEWLAINDVSMHRQPGKRVADLSYAVGPDEIGRVRCDGLVVATPGGLDRLQPGQRWPRDGLGGGRVRRLVHRAAFAHRARARRRADRCADGSATAPGRSRST